MEARKAVLVTGASTGIGRKITERLAADGHFVYAGARKNTDLQSLNSLRNVQAVRLDVTSPEDIAAATDIVNRGGRGLYGLVNCAGVLTLAHILDSNDEEFDLVMTVNVHGTYRVTKALGSLIVAAQGRIVNIGSVAGIRAVATASAYSMSKYAIEAFTDSLAEELRPSGVHVSVVEPSNRNTRIAQNTLSRGVRSSLMPDLSEYSGPDDVADAVARALFEPEPRRRYLVVQNQGEASATIGKQIERLVQLNEGHSYSYERATLIEMLDAAIARSRAGTS